MRPAAGGWARVGGLLVLSAVGAELLAAYDDSTGRIGPLLFATVFFGALYGAPALLIRECARRLGWRWPSMVLLTVAAGIVQAGVIDQSLFSADYRGLEGWTETRDATIVAPLGVSASMALNFVTGHAIYSFSAPIAVAEAWRREDAERPWLGALGIAVAAAAYLGAAALIINEPDSQSATTVQMTGALATAVACTAAAAWIGRRADPASLAQARRAPAVGSVVLGTVGLAGVATVVPETWTGVAIGAGVTGLIAASVARLSRRADWTVRHAAAVALGFLLCRGVLAFTYFPLVGDVSAARKYSHNVAMLALVAAAGWLALRRRPVVRVPSTA